MCSLKVPETQPRIDWNVFNVIIRRTLALAFLGIVMKTDLSQSCGDCWVFQICWHTECSTLTASSFRILKSSAGIPSPPLSSVQFGCSVVSDFLRPHGLQHTRPPYPSPTTRVYPNSCSLSRWYHPTISSSVVSFSYCLQFFPASGSFPVSQFFISGGQRIGVSASASVLLMNIQDGFPLGWTGWISL